MTRKFASGQGVVARKQFKFFTALGGAIIVPAGCPLSVREVDNSVDGDAQYLLSVDPPTADGEFSFWTSGAEADDWLDADIPPASVAEMRAGVTYDDDCPGYLVSHGIYVVNHGWEGDLNLDDGLRQSYLIAQRPSFTPWKIEVHFWSEFSYYTTNAVFRTAYEEGRECERFSLFCSDDDCGEIMLVQIQVLTQSRVSVAPQIPMHVEVDTRKKLVTITMTVGMLFSRDEHGRVTGYSPQYPPESTYFS